MNCNPIVQICLPQICAHAHSTTFFTEADVQTYAKVGKGIGAKILLTNNVKNGLQKIINLLSTDINFTKVGQNYFMEKNSAS